MKVWYGTYVKPVFVKNVLVGWTWELYEGGEVIAVSDDLYETIEEARADAQAIQEEMREWQAAPVAEGS